MQRLKNLIIVLSVAILLSSCSLANNYIPVEDKEFAKKTFDLLNMTRKTNGQYSDFLDNFIREPNLIDTYYSYELAALLGISTERNTMNIELIQQFSNKKNGIWDLIYLYKLLNITDINDNELKNSIQRQVKKEMGKIIEGIENYDYLSPEFIDCIVLIAESKEFLSDSQLVKISPFLQQARKELLFEDDSLIYAYYPIILLGETPLNQKEISKILEGLGSMVEKKEYEEVFQLISVLDSLEWEKEDVLSNILQREIDLSKLTNYQLYYYLKLLSFTTKLDAYKEDVANRISNSQIIGGGYVYVQDITPEEYTYFSLYIIDSLGNNINATDFKISNDYLFEKNQINLKQNFDNINWRQVYSFVRITSDKTQLESIKCLVLEKTSEDSVSVNFSLSSNYYYLATLEKLGITKNSSEIHNYLKFTEEKLRNQDLEKGYLDYFFYSKLSKMHNRNIDDIIKENVVQTIQMSKEKTVDSFMEKDNTTNLLTTFFYLLIDREMNLNLFSDQELYSIEKELENYQSIYGGYSLIKGENPDCFATLIGIMAEHLLDKKDFEVIF